MAITDLTRVINNFSSRTMKPMFMLVVGVILYLVLAYAVNGIFALQDIKNRQQGEQA